MLIDFTESQSTLHIVFKFDVFREYLKMPVASNVLRSQFLGEACLERSI